ncbi:ran-specific GTPase-activating protein 30 [Mucor ambiguus]|uniref:Ran-specific GTPase-activating protein 30 n=1 Tax=Mucor ambiguus TaxID=91626 RepID=A0A0C9LTV3_9FUNG|nr:ran-specific GTPase-activating protein 30 [Mucor ambiguus]
MSSLEDLFGKLALTTVTTVSRIALSHATNAAIRNVTSYITTQLPKNKPDTREIRALQRQLDLKIKNLKPTIDIIARSVADGNADLEPALEMCNDLKSDMDDFAAKSMDNPDQVKARLKQLLVNVDDAIPSLHLSLRSIENKTGTSAVSPAKLIQASNILEGGNVVFCVKLYSLFSANQRAASADAFTWKEEFFKASLVVKSTGEFSYELSIAENTDDGRYHEEGEQQTKRIDVSHIDRMYYTQSGELLNIEDSKSPVLVMKVNKHDKGDESKESIVEVKETAPEIVREELQESDWYAVGLWTEDVVESDSDNDEEAKEKETKKKTSDSSSSSKSLLLDNQLNLLLLESVIKLALLETTEQMNHIHASDELIALYMK